MSAHLSFAVAAVFTLAACAHDLPTTMPTGEFSLAVWLKPGKPTLGPDGKFANGQGLVLANGNGWFEGLRLVLSRRGTDAYSPCLHVGAPNGARCFPYGANISVGQWAPLVVTWDGHEFFFYVNGSLVNVNGYGKGFTPARGWTVGRAAHGIGYWPCEIADAKVLSRAMSRDEVEAHAMKGLANGREFNSMLMDWNNAAKLAMSGKRREAAEIYGRLAKSCVGTDREAAERELAFLRDGTPPAAPEVDFVEPLISRARPEVRLFVSPDGNDAAAGTLESPLRTLTAARDRMRGLRTNDVAAVVYLRGGTYPIRETLELGEEDSGSTNGVIWWSAYKDERPVLDGSREVPFALWKPWKNGIYVADLKSAGFTALVDPEKWGVGIRSPEGLTQFYCDGKPLTRARHPNAGFLEIRDADCTNKTFRLEGLDDLSVWKDERQLKVTGYVDAFWADRSGPVIGIDVANGRFKVPAELVRWKLAPMNGRCLFLQDALRALDAPGEYWLDYEKGLLYLKPEKPLAGSRITVTQADATFVTLRKAHDIGFRGLVFEGGRRKAITGNGGRIAIIGNVIRNFGESAVSLGGAANLVDSNVIHTFGSGGVSVHGGERKSRRRAGTVVSNNEIFDLARHRRTYSPAVQTSGCGILIRGNHFHDMRSSAMRLDGSDMIVVSNRVNDCVLESDDQGAVDIYGNPSYTGIRIVGNLWKDIGRGGKYVPTGQAGVRCDDWISGVFIFGNRFVKCGNAHFGAVQINGGRQNVIDNNVFIDCHKDVSSINGRTDEVWRRHCEKFVEFLPGLVDYPKGNPIVRNILIRTPSARSRGLGDNRTLDDEGGTRGVYATSAIASVADESAFGVVENALVERARRNDDVGCKR